ncbi:MAG: two-component sensor histidine kinase [Bacteroidales bacterium]|nr:two-component sensor histidine kinase [Bacteroidales bacterium]
MKKARAMILNIFRNRFFTYYFLVFIIFTFIIVLFQFYREREYRRDRFKAVLDNVSGLAHNYLEKSKQGDSYHYEDLNDLIAIVPLSNIRITIIDKQGSVLFDSDVGDYEFMENHIGRPEVREAIKNNTGASVRRSSSTGKKYFYYAHNYDDYITRTAAEYTYDVQSSLKIDKLFLIFIIIMFLIVLAAMIYINERMSLAVNQLKNFAASALEEKELKNIEFPKSELGNIGNQILDIYNELKHTRDELITEQEKIFRHLQTMEEGVAVFSPNREIVVSNNAFIQNANLISDSTLESPGDVLKVEEIKPLMDYLERKSFELKLDMAGEVPYKEIICQKKNKYFLVRANIFKDNSFEIIIKDITKAEKNKVLKQQLTSNIAHELRTPVTSIIGYLETLLSADIGEEQSRLFLSRTKDQAMRLAELIDHISVLNKLEEGSGFYEIEDLMIYEVIEGVVDSMRMRLESKHMRLVIDLDPGMKVPGNKLLIHSIYQNLIENTINYAGENINIRTELHYEDENFYYFRYSNDGRSIPDKHIPRLFERFYRIDEGRSRKRGGTGLGLAIVKHAVQYHRGQISVKNMEGGGIEFLFSISKSLV